MTDHNEPDHFPDARKMVDLAARIERAEGLIEAVAGEHGWRRREVQAIGAAISTRNWQSLEAAYNELRDKMDRAIGGNACQSSGSADANSLMALIEGCPARHSMHGCPIAARAAALRARSAS